MLVKLVGRLVILENLPIAGTHSIHPRYSATAPNRRILGSANRPTQLLHAAVSVGLQTEAILRGARNSTAWPAMVQGRRRNSTTAGCTSSFLLFLRLPSASWMRSFYSDPLRGRRRFGRISPGHRSGSGVRCRRVRVRREQLIRISPPAYPRSSPPLISTNRQTLLKRLYLQWVTWIKIINVERFTHTTHTHNNIVLLNN